MTQTSTSTPARNTFLAADAEVTVENDGDRIAIDFTDDNPSRLATVLIGTYGAQQLLNQLAKALGATVVTEGQKQDLGMLVRDAIVDADERDNRVAVPAWRDLNAHRDALRDLRDVFLRADIISG